MNKGEIIRNFLTLKNKKGSSTKYFVIQGHGGVGKTILLNEIQNKLILESSFFLYINTEIEVNPEDFWKSISKQILNRGYQGKNNSKDNLIYSPNSEQENISTNREDIDNEYFDLPLFQIDITDSPSKNPIQILRKEDIELIIGILNEISFENPITLLLDSSVINRTIENLIVRLINKLTTPPIIIIACRKKLPVLWPTEDDLSEMNFLDPFDRNQAINFLQSINHYNEVWLDEFYILTGGYCQFLFDTVNYWNSKERKLITPHKNYILYISQKIIDCYFREVIDPEIQKIIKIAALCRIISFNAVNVFANKRIKEQEYNKLLECSFIQKNLIGLQMLPVLQLALLEIWQDESPNEFKIGVDKLDKYYSTHKKRTDFGEKLQIEICILYDQLFLNETQGLITAQKFLYEADENFDLNKLQVLLAELIIFPYKNKRGREFLLYWNALQDQYDYKWDEAEEKYRLIINSVTDTTLRGLGYYRLGQIMKIRGNWDDADKQFLSSIDLFVSSKNSDLRFNSQIIKANITFRKHNWREALIILDKALETAQKNKNTTWLFLVNLHFGKLFRSQGNWPLALEYLSTAQQFSIELNNFNYMANVFIELGKLYRSQEKWDESIENFGKCLEIRMELKDVLGEAICLHSLGTTMFRQGKLQEAKRYYKDSITKKESIKDKYGIAKSTCGLGHIERVTGDAASAIECYKEAVNLFEATNNKTKASRVLCRLGMTYANQGLWENAGECLRQSQVIRSKSNDKQGVSESLYELGLLQEDQGDSIDALESFRLSLKFADESLSIGRKIPPIVALARTFMKLGANSSAFNSVEEARIVGKSYQRNQSMAEEFWKWGVRDYDNGLIEIAYFCFAEAIDFLVTGGFEVNNYCAEMIARLEKITDEFGEEKANDLSRMVISQWESFSDVGGILHRSIALASYESGSRIKNKKQIKNICDRIIMKE